MKFAPERPEIAGPSSRRCRAQPDQRIATLVETAPPLRVDLLVPGGHTAITAIERDPKPTHSIRRAGSFLLAKEYAYRTTSQSLPGPPCVGKSSVGLSQTYAVRALLESAVGPKLPTANRSPPANADTLRWAGFPPDQAGDSQGLGGIVFFFGRILSNRDYGFFASL